MYYSNVIIYLKLQFWGETTILQRTVNTYGHVWLYIIWKQMVIETKKYT